MQQQPNNMRYLFIIVGSVIFCNSSYSQTVFRASLTGSQVVTGTPSANASAIADFELSNDETTLSYVIQLTNLELDATASPADDVDSVHIYVGSPGSTGTLVFIIDSDNNSSDDSELDENDADDILSGNWDNNDSVPLSAHLTDLKNGNLYLKIYSQNQGDIRGQIIDITPIPTLSEWGLIILSIGLMIFGVIALRVYGQEVKTVFS